MQADIYEFLDLDIREASLRTAQTVAEQDFCLPVLSTLRSCHKEFTGTKADEMSSKVSYETEKNLNEDCALRKRQILNRLKKIKTDIVERPDLIASKTAFQDFQATLDNKIENGDETSAYSIYLEIRTEKKYRGFPYYFEIETIIVDKLNSLVKDYFLSKLAEITTQLLVECNNTVKEFIIEIEESIQYSPEVSDRIGACVNDRELELKSGVRLNGVICASRLDELLCYKTTKKGMKNILATMFRYQRSEIIQGLEHAAKLGFEQSKDGYWEPKKEDFIKKTVLIRDVLKKYYTATIGSYFDLFTKEMTTPLVDIIQNVEQEILDRINELYRPCRKKIIERETAAKHEEHFKSIGVKARLYKDWIEQIDKNRVLMNLSVATSE